jgi:hypothetical protein
VPNPSKQTNPLDYPRYVKGIRPALAESLPQYVDDELEKLAGSIDNMAVAADKKVDEKVGPVSSRIDTVESNFLNGLTNANARITTEETARANADEAMASRVTTVEASFNTGLSNANARITTEETARANADGAIATRITNVEADYNNKVNATNARVTTEETARANADSALASRTTTLEASVNDANTGLAKAHARVTDEASARATADTALANRATTLEATVNDANTGLAKAHARVTDEAAARATADSALANRTTTLEASVNDPTTGLSNAHARVTSEATARADRDTALASDISTVSTTVNGHTTTINNHATSINGLSARQGVRLDANGYITGYVQNNNGSQGDFIVTADIFKVVKPGQVPKELFAVDSITNEIRLGLPVKFGSVGAPEMGGAAMGEAAMTYNDSGVSVNSTSTWVDIASVSLTPKHGKPLKVDFNTFALCTNAASTRLRLRVVRADGTSIYGGSNGSEVRINDEGTALCIRAVAGSEANSAQTFRLQGIKSVNTENVSFGQRVAYVEELSRVNFQSFSITTSDGSGPTSGTGGGGGTYDPNVSSV